MKAQRESNRIKQEGSILFLFSPFFLLSPFHIAAEKTVGTVSSKHILKHLENSEKRQQEKLDKIAEAFKSDLTALTETLVDIFKQRNRTPV